MNERPIIFTSESVLSILAGRKTQTRRVVAPANCAFGSASPDYWQHADFSQAWVDGRTPFDGTRMEYLHVPCHAQEEGVCAECDRRGWTTTTHRLWPGWWPYKAYVGEEKERPPYRAWVKEKFNRCGCDACREAWPKQGPHGVTHVAGYGGPSGIAVTSPLFMPRWASRITLEITDVRVQRVQDISVEDAGAEGCGLPDPARGFLGEPRKVFHLLWESINGKKHPWAENPWVWVLTFCKVDAPHV